MVLTAENYYSQEANEEYMSVSQFKDFCGTYGKMPCEFTAMEKLKGRWEEPKSKALMVGSYVDSYFEGTLDKFKAENPDLFKRDGTLKAEFVKADEIIQRIERDDYFMKFMSGKKQVKAEDKLILGERIFLIQGIDDPGSIGVCTIYYVEERMDVK